MPAQTQDNMKGTSPSKNIQRGIDQAWGQQQGTTSVDQALKDKHTNDPVPVPGSK